MRHPRHPTTPSNPAPRWLTLRSPGPCAACGKYLARGETAYYDPPTKQVWGVSCGHAQAGADEVAKRPPVKYWVPGTEPEPAELEIVR